MQVEPSCRIDSFSLGMPIGDAVDFIQRNCGQGNTLTYNPVSPASDRYPTVINVRDIQLKLYFSHDTQEMLKLTLSSPWKTEIVLIQKYERIRICSPDDPLIFDQLETFPLRKNIVRSRCRCQVVCTGICFTFDPETLHLKEISIFHDGSDVKPIAPPPFSVYYPPGFYTLRYINLSRRSKKGPVIGLTAGLTCCTAKRVHKVENIDVDNFESILLENNVKIENFERHILFGDSLQDVLTELGTPEKSYYQEKPSRLLARNDYYQLSDTVPSGDLYLNYKSLGLDVVISGTSHKVIRIVLHSNFPGHYDFNLYRRCPFALDIQCCCHHIIERPNQLKGIKHQVLKVMPIMKWSEIHKHVKCGDARHVAVLKRNIAKHDPITVSTSDCYAFDQLVFEVMTNGHIATVTVLPDAPFETCSCGDKNPHILLPTVSRMKPLDSEITATNGKSVAFLIASDSTKSNMPDKSRLKSEIKVNPSFFVPLENQNQCLKHDNDDLQAKAKHDASSEQHGDIDDVRVNKIVNTDKSNDRGNCIQTVTEIHPFSPADICLKSNGIDGSEGVTNLSKSREHTLPTELTDLPAGRVQVDISTSQKEFKESSFQAYHDGFAPHVELSRSPPQHLLIPNHDTEALTHVTSLQHQQQQHANQQTDTDTTDERLVSCLVESQVSDDMFVSALGNADGMHSPWSTSTASDPAVSSLSSLISESGKVS